MKELKNFKGVITFLFILTIINFMPIEKDKPTQYVQGENEIKEDNIAINM